MRGGLRPRWLQILFAGPAVAFIVLMLVLPVGYTIWLSSTSAVGNISATAHFIGAENYRRFLFDDPRFWPAVWRTLLFTVTALSIQMVLGTAVALLLDRTFRGRKLARIIILLPLVATPVAVGMMWMMILEPTIGFANQALTALGLPGQGWLSDPRQSMATVIFIDVWQWSPLVALIVLAGLTTVPRELIEAAKVDGTPAWKRFWFVILPTIWPTVIVAALLRGIDALKTFDLLYATKGPGGGSFNEVETLNIYAYGLTFEYSEYGYASAVLMAFFLIVVLAVGLLAVYRTMMTDTEDPRGRNRRSKRKRMGVS